MVEFVNNTCEPNRFSDKVPLGILDLRALGYFNMNYKDIVSKLGEHFNFYHYAQEKASSEHGDKVYSKSKHPNICMWEQMIQTHTPGWNLMTPQHQSDYQILKSKVD